MIWPFRPTFSRSSSARSAKPLRASAWRNGSKSSRISLMSAVPVAVEPNGIGRYPQEIEAAVYFCTLEALNNVAK